jgi:hypothetical protein
MYHPVSVVLSPREVLRSVPHSYGCLGLLKHRGLLVDFILAPHSVICAPLDTDHDTRCLGYFSTRQVALSHPIATSDLTPIAVIPSAQTTLCYSVSHPRIDLVCFSALLRTDDGSILAFRSVIRRVP